MKDFILRIYRRKNKGDNKGRMRTCARALVANRIRKLFLLLVQPGNKRALVSCQGRTATTAAMLQLLTFLLEKLSLLSAFKVFQSAWPDSDPDQERRAHRGPPQLRRGDLLEVPRTLFTHYGIYLGDQKVAHLIPDILPVLTDNQRLISSVISNQRLILGCIYRCATVRVDTLEDFAYGSKILVNGMDKMMKSKVFSDEDVAKRAEQLIGGIPYSLLWNNCEHFVTYCRYGTAASRQTEKVEPFRDFCDWRGKCVLNNGLCVFPCSSVSV